jgi:hypothetical protein
MKQQLANNIAIASSSCGSFENQIICRPVNVMTSVSANNSINTDADQIKCNIMTGNDWLKQADVAMLSNCNNSNQSNKSMSGTQVSAINNNHHNIAAHQIAIQVICQDGTSLVLPVSAAPRLSTALSSTSNQQQQLQAVLTNGVKSGVSLQQRHPNQILPLISVSNILAQQQSGNNALNTDASVSISEQQSSNQTANNTTQTTGLAASSPTLAALLDAGSSRTNNSDSNSAASNNLMRKFVGGNVDLKRGEFNLHPGTQIGLTNNGSLVTICATNNCSTTNHAINSNLKHSHGTQCIGDKRIKLENATEAGVNTQHWYRLLDSSSQRIRSYLNCWTQL